MYHTSTISKVSMGVSYSDSFNVKVGVDHGSVLSPLLFINILEALSRKFKTGCPWEMLYVDDLVVISDTIEHLTAKVSMWKRHCEVKGPRVNMKKMKVMCSGNDLDILKNAGRWPCGVCRNNSILCTSCHNWLHKSCCGVKGRLTADLSHRCQRYQGTAKPIDDRLVKQVDLDGNQLKVADTFCYR